MDMQKELKELIYGDDFGAEVINQVTEQQNELEKKMHILKAASLAYQIEALVATDFFSKDDMQYLQLNCDYDQDNGRHMVEFHLADENNAIMVGYYDHQFNEQAEVLYQIFGNLDNFNFDLANSQLKYGSANLELKPGIKEEILTLFLDSELKKIYNTTKVQVEYNQMNAELPINNTNTKKIKM
jgi:hypothetical protein